MLSSSAKAALLDILYHIELSEAFSSDLDQASFKTDLKTIYGVTEIISEASRRVPDEVKARHPHIAWRQMAGAGNVYRHDYEDVAADLVWETLQRALPPLKMAVQIELATWHAI